MAYNSFPYTNYHELNLDYLLNKSKEIEGNVQETADNVLRATQQADRSTQQAVNSQNSATASAQSAAASSQSAVNSANSAAASAQSAEEARAAAGDPKTFTAATQLTDTTKIYVYVGETGTYTYGHYYYYQGGSWHDGGVYGTWATDDALSDTSTNAVQNKVVNAAVSELKSDLDYTKNSVGVYENLWKPDDVVANHYYANGAAVESATLSYIIIPCNVGDTFYFGNGGESANARFVNALTSDGANIRTVNNVSEFEVESGSKIAVTFSNNYAKPQINKDELQPYVPYGSSLVMEKIEALEANAVHPVPKNADMTIPVGVDTDGKLFATEQVFSPLKYKSLYAVGNLSNGDYIIQDKETALKKGESLTFSCNITSFDKLTLGWSRSTPGTQKSPYCEITNTQIIVHALNNNGPAAPGLNHGLTIAVNLQFRMTLKHNAIDVELISNGERFTGSVNVFKSDQGFCFAMSEGSTLTDCRLAWCSSDIDKTIWMFGDSYFGLMNNSRWPYYMQLDEYTDNVLMDAYAGRNSENAIITLNSLLTLGKPDYLVWCLGMNDGSDTNAETPSAAWVSGRDTVISLCEAAGIVPVFATIPNVPSIRHTGKNAWVKSSGYRYIDFAQAVGAAESGSTWYDGMLSSDNVHPTAKGATALYGQVLSDFPEITVA